MIGSRTLKLASSAVAALVLVLAPAAQAQLLVENFDDVSALPGSGWVFTNDSATPLVPWFQGNRDVFPAWDGLAGAYVAANFLTTAEDDEIANWLITPQIALVGGETLRFYTRAEFVAGSPFADGLRARLGVGSSTALSNFSTELLVVGPLLTLLPYPTAWQLYTVVIPQVGGMTSGRIAFEYFAEAGSQASYIGIDSVTVISPNTDADSDGVLDATDNCPTVPNPGQQDGAGGLEITLAGAYSPDGVGDACDNCVRVNNPRRPADYLTSNPWRTLTGGQVDDDHDGYGNRCDGKFVGLPTASVGALDLGQMRTSSGESRLFDTCGTAFGTRPCAIFDLDEAAPGNSVGALDLGRFRALLGSTPGPRCAACTGTGSVLLPCTAGTAGACGP